jgi:hypothetical protein
MVSSGGGRIPCLGIPCLGRLAADTKAHRPSIPHLLVIQVDQNDPAVMNLASNNATNVIEYYRAKGEEVEEVNVDVVTYGPGLHMLRADTSPVRDRIKNLRDLSFPARSGFPHATSPRKAWRRRKATRSRCRPRLPSFRRASFACGAAGEGLRT